MARIADTFARLRASGSPGLVAYVTAGDPNLARTAEILVDPSSEGAVRLLSRLPGECDPNTPPAGATTACEPTIDQTSNIPAQNIVAATRVASDDGAAYAGMTDEDAASVASAVASFKPAIVAR